MFIVHYSNFTTIFRASVKRMGVLWVRLWEKKGKEKKIEFLIMDDRSHNATMGAWGKLSITRDSKQPKMSIK